jgi:hypothetical protein
MDKILSSPGESGKFCFILSVFFDDKISMDKKVFQRSQEFPDNPARMNTSS